MYSIGQFAKKTGLTVRALRFYSEKGLIEPCYISESGHRYYNDGNIETLQKIVTLKYLDYSLEEIEDILQNGEQQLIESLMFQKRQLEKKRNQIDRVITSLDQAINIGKQKEAIDTSIFLTMIFNLLKEDEQRDYWRGMLPDELIERLYNFFGMNMIEFNRKYMALANQLKQAYVQPIQDDSLKALMEQLLSLIPQDMVEDLVEVLKEYEDIELNDWLFPTPFTKEEEEWFISQAERLGVYRGEADE
ncbi:MerR family transcriptional regulator [Lysinibacillus mangiferihumi]|uniref:MerR family transcriptional regulator n=1 Tax=Lysinibacillus mangiferihumi TaxID=1130819 RepID=A0A4U2Z3L5_9BACI|nr:MerR family transcriptional regulator [Lysinibacillus mangiferihumi]TKI68364.1 MerR family transcriptional regulator [Lysinibacillus mangiferihumi]